MLLKIKKYKNYCLFLVNLLFKFLIDLISDCIVLVFWEGLKIKGNLFLVNIFNFKGFKLYKFLRFWK